MSAECPKCEADLYCREDGTFYCPICECVSCATLIARLKRAEERAAVLNNIALERWIMIAMMCKERGGEFIIPARILKETSLYEGANIVTFTRPEDGATVIRYRAVPKKGETP